MTSVATLPAELCLKACQAAGLHTFSSNASTIALTVVVAHRPPMIITKDRSSEGPDHPVCSGLLLDLLPKLLQQANISANIKFYEMQVSRPVPFFRHVHQGSHGLQAMHMA